MKRWMVLLDVLLAALLVTGCAPSGRSGPPATGGPGTAATSAAGRQVAGHQEPGLRAINFGFENVSDPHTDWKKIDQQLEAANVNAVSIAVGRPEWTAFPWPGHLDSAAADGPDKYRDFVGAAVNELQTDPSGQRRHVSLGIDLLLPATLKKNPKLAGVDADGKVSDGFASPAAFDTTIGTQIDEMVNYLGTTYHPDEVVLTELFLDRFVFSSADLDLYRKNTGAKDWPRTKDGKPDLQNAAVVKWRSEVLARVVSRARDAAHAAGTTLAVDVRVNWADPAAGRPDSAQDYALLKSSADRLVLWAYPGMSGLDGSAVGKLTTGLTRGGYDPDRLTISVGLWSASGGNGQPGTTSGEGVIDARTLAASLASAADAGARSISVTPYSLLTDKDWDVIKAAWGG